MVQPVTNKTKKKEVNKIAPWQQQPLMLLEMKLWVKLLRQKIEKTLEIVREVDGVYTSLSRGYEMGTLAKNGVILFILYDKSKSFTRRQLHVQS